MSYNHLCGQRVRAKRMFAKYRGIVCGIIAATLFVGIASAGEKEPVAVLELGGASAWNVPEKLLLEEEP